MLLLTLCAIAGTLATAYLAGRSRRWTALGVALAPGLIFASFINWDLIAMALVAVGMAAWAARRTVLAGVLLGLAVATKFYPVLFFGPLLLLCLRAGRMRAFWITTASAAVAWLAVNLPVAFAAPSGWARFYTLSKDRPADWGSVWYFFETEHWPFVGSLTGGSLNLFSAAVFAAGCVVIGALILTAPRRPRVPQVFFLVLAVFLLSNKVWSPQYVIWLVPLVVLARPRLWAYAVWQVAEVTYFFAIWAYLITIATGTGLVPVAEGGISAGVYFAALLARFAAVLILVALVVRDILHPEHDLVRAVGDDDPAGGVLDNAPDRFSLAAVTLARRGVEPGLIWFTGARATTLCRPLGRGSRRPPGPRPRGPRPAAVPARSCRTRWRRACLCRSRTRPASCCSAPGRSGR